MLRKLILVFMASLLLPIKGAAQEGVKWENCTFEQALQKASQENRLVFMDCYTSWCGPCKRMLKQVFTTPEAGAFFNERFVNVKFDMEKGEGIALAKKYKVEGFPTFLIFDGNGNVVGRKLGGASLEDFIRAVKDISSMANSPAKLLEVYRKSGKAEDALAYIDRLHKMEMNDELNGFVAEHFQEFRNGLPSNATALNALSPAISLSNMEVIRFLTDHKAEFCADAGEAEMARVVHGALGNSLYSYFHQPEHLLPDDLQLTRDLAASLPDSRTEMTFISKDVLLLMLDMAIAQSRDDHKSMSRLALDYRTPCAPKTMDQFIMAELIFSRTEIPEKTKLRFIRMRGKVCQDDVTMLTDLYNRYREENK